MAIKTAEDIKQLGTILCVGAHPDDETWIAGGILASAAKNGQKVVVITATRGEAGTTDESRWPKHQLGNIRTQELHNALRILGVEEHGMLECLDGECDQADEQDMALQLASVMHRERPNTVLTFGPEGLTGHNDHAAVSRWVSKAVQLVDCDPKVYHAVHTAEWYERAGRELDEKANVFFNLEEPSFVQNEDLAICFNLTDEISNLKLQALQAQESQMEELLSKFESNKLPEALAQECFKLSS
jgi:LmbE family N-acetylglucosaminyl deacetylase